MTGCPRDPARAQTANVEVVVSSFPTVIRRDLSLEQLARLPGVESVGPGRRLQGLTMVHHRLGYRTGVAVSGHLFGGEPCAWIDHLTVDMTPDKIEIDVPSDYPETSCEYEEILAHERLHEEAHRGTLADSAADMRRALAQADFLPARGAPLTVADRADAEKRIEALVDRAARPVYADFERTLAMRQAVIDLPANYRWTTKRCSNWK